jgi:hypothetical protein
METKPTAAMSWMQRLRRVFAMDLRHCPRCGGTMRVIAAITQPALMAIILRRRQPSARAPPGAAMRDLG